MRDNCCEHCAAIRIVEGVRGYFTRRFSKAISPFSECTELQNNFICGRLTARWFIFASVDSEARNRSQPPNRRPAVDRPNANRWRRVKASTVGLVRRSCFRKLPDVGSRRISRFRYAIIMSGCPLIRYSVSCPPTRPTARRERCIPDRNDLKLRVASSGFFAKFQSFD